MTSAPRASILAAGALAATVTSLVFFHLGSYGLWEPDEARYAEIAREMLESGGFLIPHLNYVAYIEKPPLLYWLTAASFRLFGLHEFAARVPSALAALAGVAATYLFARGAFDRRRALLAAAILATAPLYTTMAQVLTTDMLLTACTTIAIFAFFLHWRDGGAWRWLFYAGMGLGTLAKGPVAIVIPIAIAITFAWWQNDLVRTMRTFRPVSGLCVTFAIAAPWFVSIAFLQPGFVDFYFIGEHLRRFMQSSYSHGQPFYYYAPVLVAGLLPWSLIAFLGTWRNLWSNPARTFCMIAAIVIALFFSTASAKLIPYILPAFPPIAILIADALLTESPSQRLWLAVPILTILGLAAIATSIAAPLIANPYLNAAKPALLALGCILIVDAVIVLTCFQRRQIDAALVALAITSCALPICGSYARLALEPLRSYAQLASEVAARAPSTQIICYYRFVEAIPFYSHRRVILVGPRSELDFGATHAADARDYFFDSDTDLLRLWSEKPGPVLVIDEPELKRLSARLGPFETIALEGHKRAIIPADAKH